MINWKSQEEWQTFCIHNGGLNVICAWLNFMTAFLLIEQNGKKEKEKEKKLKTFPNGPYACGVRPQKTMKSKSLRL